jgi:hypothetical protein
MKSFLKAEETNDTILQISTALYRCFTVFLVLSQLEHIINYLINISINSTQVIINKNREYFISEQYLKMLNVNRIKY